MTELVAPGQRLLASRAARGLMYVALALVVVAQPIACGAICMAGPFGPIVVIGMMCALALIFALYVGGPSHHAMMRAWAVRQRRRAIRAQLKQAPDADAPAAWAALRDELRAALITQRGAQPPPAATLLEDVLACSWQLRWLGASIWAFLSAPVVLIAFFSRVPPPPDLYVVAFVIGGLWALEAIWSAGVIRHLERRKARRSYLDEVRHIASVEELAGGLSLAGEEGGEIEEVRG